MGIFRIGDVKMTFASSGESEMVEGCMSLILPDGRVVPIPEETIDIMETGEAEAGDEAAIGSIVTADFIGDQLRYEDFLERVTCFKCRLCKHLSESRTELIQHLKSKHEEDINCLEDMKNEDLPPENDITGLSFVLTDQKSVAGSCLDISESIVVRPEQAGSKEEGCGGDTAANSLAKGGFLCGGCSRCFDSEQQISAHLSSSLACSAAADTGDEGDLGDNVGDQKPGPLPLEADHQSRVLKCSVKFCSFMFKHADQLKYHISCHNFESSDFICKECDEKFMKWRDCATHLWRDHSIDCDMLQCGCGYKTMSYKMLKAHSQTHENLRQFKCDVCSKGFNQMSQLKNHVVTHLDKTIAEVPSWAKPKQCDICQKVFSDSKSLKKHVQAIHSKLKPYICNVCNHKSARKAMLQLHMRQHTGDKPYSCDSCDYKTGDHNSLRRHKRRHTGDKPYKCPLCPYAAIQSSSYKSHLKSKHPEHADTELKGGGGQTLQTVAEILTSSNNPTPGESQELVLSGLPGVILVGLDKTESRDQVVIATGNFNDMSVPLNI